MASNNEHVDKCSEVPKEILRFMKKHSSLEYNQEKKRVRCQLSGHEFPCQLDALQSYTCGRKYKKLKSLEKFDLKKYGPHIAPSFKKSHEHQLFCRLTLKHLNKISAHVERHINGRRYKKGLKKYEECQRLGIKYVPASRQRPPALIDTESDGEVEKRFFTNPEDIGKESDAESDDSFSDLYPVEDFSVNMDQADEEEVEQDDSEKEDEDDVENMEVEEAKPTRRKNTETNDKGHIPNKKLKKNDSGTKFKTQTAPQNNQSKGNHPTAGKSGKGKKKKKKKPRIM